MKTQLPKEYSATDWMDTEESQKLLNYQTRTIDDYVKDIQKALGIKLLFIKPKKLTRKCFKTYSFFYLGLFTVRKIP